MSEPVINQSAEVVEKLDTLDLSIAGNRQHLAALLATVDSLSEPIKEVNGTQQIDALVAFHQDITDLIWYMEANINILRTKAS